jgi:uncharacterized protein (DUF3820 family)
MPRDEWARANARAKYGQAPPAEPRKKRSHRGKAHDDQAIDREPEIVASRMTPDTVLWFGKYQGKRIADAPRDYLQWVTTMGTDNWRIRGLIYWLLYVYLHRPPVASVRTQSVDPSILAPREGPNEFV